METSFHNEHGSNVLNTIIRKNHTIFTDAFSEEVFNQTYRLPDDSDINDRHLKVARDLARVEDPKYQKYWTNQFLELLEDFKFVPGGRITSNAGAGLQGTTYINCFVSGFRGEDQDSMASIMDELKRQALILKSEGGYGFCANVMRPRGAYVNGIGGYSPGAVKLLEMWDTQSAVITSGCGLSEEKVKKGKKKIRKGAQMVTLSIWHPDIEEFIKAKQTPGRLTKFNMSVLVTDDFMQALNENKPWSLEFPDFEAVPDKYKKYWNGDIKSWKSKGLVTKIYKIYDRAQELWDLIMKSTYTRNEPGVLFVDTINRWNNLYYEEYIQATNPCGEQVLPVGGVCLLGSFNLTQFISYEKKDWDYDKLKRYIPIAVRFLDNVNDITLVPLDENKENLKSKRRIGVGLLGYASALMAMNIRYGSKEALEKTEALGQFIMNHTYEASALLAKEKGVFPHFIKKDYLKGLFVSKLNEDVRELISKYGIRNSHLLSIQPTGNSSVLANNVSGGIEPIFSAEYTRTVIQQSPPKGLSVPINIDWSSRVLVDYEGEQQWEWVKEGDEDLLKTKYENIIWKLDRNRGLLKETPVIDWAVRALKDRGMWNPKANWAASSHELALEDHVETLKIFSQYVDSAISKTVNLPHDFAFDDFKNLYLDIFKTGTIKGCTTYREGTMAAVLSSSLKSEGSVDGGKIKAIPRPKSMDCDIYQVKSNNVKWMVLVGILNESPYEVFAMRQNSLHLSPNIKRGKLIKESSGIYHLQTSDGWLLKDIRKFFESDEQEALTRLISTSLRHGVDIEFIVDQLLKSEGTIYSFSRAIARTLKNYIQKVQYIKCEECRGQNIKIEEGCFTCLDCGVSKCT
ncbi:MAG: adenosylcobalamin-dependent ribonucleoside-diphosphate reductase [Bdellovibrionales bacterium]|nr:adenosylcobalamin-dependent ribonucleoside-diphosphate reductase [Bdellovibrionales bacterium]